jgi:hypothetical protein
MKTISRAGIFLAAMIVAVTMLLTCRMNVQQPSGPSKVKMYNTDRLITMDRKGVSRLSKNADKMERNGSNRVIVAAKRISKGGHRALLVTMVNDAFLPFVFSWLCNTQTMGIHSQILFITGDQKSAKKITKMWPEVSAVPLDGIHSGNQEYSHVGYVELMVRRSEIILEILEKNIPVFLFEVDCLWIRNPIKNLKRHRGVDIIVNAVSERPKFIAGGFLYLHPTRASKQLWRALTRKLTHLGKKIQNSPDTMLITEMENDQTYLSQLVFAKYGGLTYKILPTEDYADGKWYTFSKEKRNKLKPYLINNNWVRGNRAKIKRAKKWGHWFLKDADTYTCDWERVKNIVHLQ